MSGGASQSVHGYIHHITFPHEQHELCAFDARRYQCPNGKVPEERGFPSCHKRQKPPHGDKQDKIQEGVLKIGHAGLPDLPRGEPRGFAREGFWLGKVLISHTEVFRVVLTDKPLWDRYLLRSQPSKPLTGQLRADRHFTGFNSFSVSRTGR